MSTPLCPSPDPSLKKVSASRISTPSLIRPPRPLLCLLLLFWSTPLVVKATREYRMFSVAGMGDDDWDLSAVVRSCQPSSARAGRKSPWLFPPPSGPLMTVEGGKGGAFMRLSEVFESPKGDRDMEELKPFFLKAQSLGRESGSWPPSSSAAESSPHLTMAGSEQPLRRRKVDLPLSQTPRSRRRKNQQKKVVRHVAAEGLSSDLWSWRKYGQKPIKGSPYPRGYYRCSSSKGCPARKLVERNRTDPTIFILTYTAEHNHPMPTHRNSLAGSTRNRFPNPPSGNPEASPLSTTSGPELSPTTPLSATDLSMPKQGEDLVDEEAEAEAEEDDDEVELLVDDIEVMGEDDLLFVSSEEGGAASAAVELTPLLVNESRLEDDLFHLEWLSHCNNSAERRNSGACDLI